MEADAMTGGAVAAVKRMCGADGAQRERTKGRPLLSLLTDRRLAGKKSVPRIESAT
jgi:hypothetical protein